MTAPVIAMMLSVVCALVVIVMILGAQRPEGWKQTFSRYIGALRDRSVLSSFSSLRAEAAAISEPVAHTGDLRVGDLWELSEPETDRHR